MNNNVFLKLFSDEASAPSASFLESLETQFLSKARFTQARTLKTKIIFGSSVIIVISLILGLVFLPKRDMSDPNKDSLIETVITESQEGASSFAESSEDQQGSQSDKTETEKTISIEADKTQKSTPSFSTIPNQDDNSNQQNVENSLTGFIAEFWNLASYGDGVSPTMPLSPADYSTTKNTINFNWAMSSPMPGVINVDGFVARFTKDTSDLSGQYKVTYSSDNGIRMFVDETVVFDHWNESSSAGEAYFTADSSVVTNTVIVEYYELDGSAEVTVEIIKM